MGIEMATPLTSTSVCRLTRVHRYHSGKPHSYRYIYILVSMYYERLKAESEA